MGGRIRIAVRIIWLNIGVALLVLTLMEGVGAGYLSWRERQKFAASLVDYEQRFESDSGTDQSWVREYVRDLDSAREEWSPYIYWRVKPYRSKYINISEAGLRRTWNRTSSPVPGQLKVFMFGGSTLWGIGARDDFTIPSFVSKMLPNELGSGAWVTNFAETGYVSTQEVIALMLELRKGSVPDVVVFFDGVNDTFSAFQNGVAGIPGSESNRAVEFNSRDRFSWRPAIEHLALYKLIAVRMRRYVGASPAPILPADDRSADALARAVVDVYLQNVRIVDALAQRFGFRAFFFWQPTVFSKRHLSQREQQWYMVIQREFWPRRSTQFFPKAYGALRERMRTSKIENVYDLSGVFDDVSGTVFIDEWHITEAANEKIAELITQTLLREVKGHSKGEEVKGGIAFRR